MVLFGIFLIPAFIGLQSVFYGLTMVAYFPQLVRLRPAEERRRAREGCHHEKRSGQGT